MLEIWKRGGKKKLEKAQKWGKGAEDRHQVRGFAHLTNILKHRLGIITCCFLIEAKFGRAGYSGEM